ncbi:hypothetical protein IC615_17240 [Serratia ureilytica]
MFQQLQVTDPERQQKKTDQHAGANPAETNCGIGFTALLVDGATVVLTLRFYSVYRVISVYLAGNGQEIAVCKKVKTNRITVAHPHCRLTAV